VRTERENKTIVPFYWRDKERSMSVVYEVMQNFFPEPKDDDLCDILRRGFDVDVTEAIVTMWVFRILSTTPSLLMIIPKYMAFHVCLRPLTSSPLTPQPVLNGISPLRIHPIECYRLRLSQHGSQVKHVPLYFWGSLTLILPPTVYLPFQTINIVCPCVLFFGLCLYYDQ